MYSLRVAEPWNNLPNSVIQATSINSFKNRLHKFWSTQAITYDYGSPLTMTTGTENCEPLIFDSEEEDLIMEEPSGSCDQNRHKVSYGILCLHAKQITVKLHFKTHVDGQDIRHIQILFIIHNMIVRRKPPDFMPLTRYRNTTP